MVTNDGEGKQVLGFYNWCSLYRITDHISFSSAKLNVKAV